LPTAANRGLADAVDAPDFVLRVSNQFTSEDVTEQLMAAYNAGLHHQRLTPARERFVQEHNFDNYAVQLLRLLGLAA
jgi:hypothetical protein